MTLRKHRRPYAALLPAAALSILLFAGKPAAAQVAAFNFESIPQGTHGPFFQTDNGLTAFFAAPSHQVIRQFGQFRLMVLNILYGTGDINIIFDRPIASFSTVFGLWNTQFVPLTGTVTVDAFLGPNLVGTVTATGTHDHGPSIPPATIWRGSLPSPLLPLSGFVFTRVPT